MVAEFALPFSATTHAIENLPEVQLDEKMTLVAVRVERNLVSINVHDLRPGDVFLFRRPDGWVANIRSRFDVIVRYQEAILAPEHSCWTHVGILDDNFQVWDAMPRLNVRCKSLREVLREGQVISIRRPRVDVDPIRLRTSLLMFSNHDYRIFRLETGGHLAARLIARAHDENNKPPADGAVICSTFVAHVLRRTTTRPFFRQLPVVVPGDFAQDDMFQDVPLYWCKISYEQTGARQPR